MKPFWRVSAATREGAAQITTPELFVTLIPSRSTPPSSRPTTGLYGASTQQQVDRILELLSPGGFIEGIKETGIPELEEFEVACLMRVLAKPELDNAVILNEFAMIMENFGVMD